MLRKNGIKRKEGFTIIEVVLVLAIAGLIFLMVFVALPALQRSQRDTQRRQDYANLEAAIQSYMTNNAGKLPAAGINLKANQYINSTGLDPNGKAYTITIKDGNGFDLSQVPTESNVWVVTKANCDGVSTNTNNSGNAAPKYVNSSRAFAIYGYLETGRTYCQASK